MRLEDCLMLDLVGLLLVLRLMFKHRVDFDGFTRLLAVRPGGFVVVFIAKPIVDIDRCVGLDLVGLLLFVLLSLFQTSMGVWGFLLLDLAGLLLLLLLLLSP